MAYPIVYGKPSKRAQSFQHLCVMQISLSPSLSRLLSPDPSPAVSANPDNVAHSSPVATVWTDDESLDGSRREEKEEEAEAEGRRSSKSLVKVPSFVCIRELESCTPQDFEEEEAAALDNNDGFLIPTIQITLSDGEVLIPDLDQEEELGGNVEDEEDDEEVLSTVFSSEDDYAIACDEDDDVFGAATDEEARAATETPTKAAVVILGPRTRDTKFMTGFEEEEDVDECEGLQVCTLKIKNIKLTILLYQATDFN